MRMYSVIAGTIERSQVWLTNDCAAFLSMIGSSRVQELREHGQACQAAVSPERASVRRKRGTRLQRVTRHGLSQREYGATRVRRGSVRADTVAALGARPSTQLVGQA